MSALQRREVAPETWADELAHLAGEGLTYLDFLAATDAGDGATAVTAHVMTPDASVRVLARTLVPAGESLDSLCGSHPAADWHEREAYELLGITFAGHPDLRPLVLPSPEAAPLRRNVALAARIAAPWPGSVDPGADPARGRNRRRAVPGIPAEWAASESGDTSGGSDE